VNWTLGIATYVVIWWLVIFAVLPFGVRPTEEGDIGHAAGAPANPRLPLKAAVTTVVAAIIWLLIFWATRAGLVDFRALVS
jgi:predicted secreted protein